MTAYMIVLARDVVAEGWGPYQSKVANCIAEHGGQYLVKRVAAQILEGDFPHQRITVFAFADMAAIRAFWDSQDYQEQIKPLRDGLGHLDVWAVPGVEETKQETAA